MTPLNRFYTQILPNKLVLPALALTYGTVLLLLVLFGQASEHEIVYIDLKDAQ